MQHRESYLQAAKECGFELAGVAAAARVGDYSLYFQWLANGRHGRMDYLSADRGRLREDPRLLMPSAKSVLCVGKLYKTKDIPDAKISRYAWGFADYHDLMRSGLEALVGRLSNAWGPFEYKICIDTAPLLERSLARAAGLGWIGKNTCLINEESGSWYFLGEVLVSVELPPPMPPEDRCGTCTRCLDACPTQALTPYVLDARRCISYHTIELREAVPQEFRAALGNHLFGCDICQDVCPWNQRAPETVEPGFQPREPTPDLEQIAGLTPGEFRERFRRTPVWRTHHRGMLRNAALVMGNSGNACYRPALNRLAHCGDPLVEEHAQWALAQLPS